MAKLDKWHVPFSLLSPLPLSKDSKAVYTAESVDQGVLRFFQRSTNCRTKTRKDSNKTPDFKRGFDAGMKMANRIMCEELRSGDTLEDEDGKHKAKERSARLSWDTKQAIR